MRVDLGRISAAGGNCGQRAGFIGAGLSSFSPRCDVRGHEVGPSRLEGHRPPAVGEGQWPAGAGTAVWTIHLVGCGAAEAQNGAAAKSCVLDLGPRPTRCYGCGERLRRRRELRGVFRHRAFDTALGQRRRAYHSPFDVIDRNRGGKDQGVRPGRREGILQGRAGGGVTRASEDDGDCAGRQRVGRSKLCSWLWGPMWCRRPRSQLHSSRWHRVDPIPTTRGRKYH